MAQAAMIVAVSVGVWLALVEGMTRFVG